jgi:DNA-binding MarR family transcriptional regulator
VAAGECARALLDGLPPVMWFIRRRMRRHRERGLSVPAFRALFLLSRFPTASLSAVAEHIGSTLPSASRLVSGLVDKGFVTRQISPTDRRVASLVLTRRGAAVLAVAEVETQDEVAAELEGLTDGQRATIVDAMWLLRGVFGTDTDRADAARAGPTAVADDGPAEEELDGRGSV